MSNISHLPTAQVIPPFFLKKARRYYRGITLFLTIVLSLEGVRRHLNQEKVFIDISVRLHMDLIARGIQKQMLDLF